MALSITVRVIGPGVSRVPEIGTIPLRLSSPTVGLRPTSAFEEAGDKIEPAVSVPTAAAGKRIGVMNSLLSDSLYAAAVEEMKRQGAVIIPYDAPDISLAGFTTLLTADMKEDLPEYLSTSAGEQVEVENVRDIVEFNRMDSLRRAPYGQSIFEEIVADTTSAEELEEISDRLQENGRKFFDIPMDAHDLDAVLSINNYHAAYAAVAKYPAIAVPAGYETTGEPKNVTFIARPFEEEKLLSLAYAFEQATKARKAPENYN